MDPMLGYAEIKILTFLISARYFKNLLDLRDKFAESRHLNHVINLAISDFYQLVLVYRRTNSNSDHLNTFILFE